MAKEVHSKKEYIAALACPMCESNKTYYRQNVRNMMCEKCGHIFDKPVLIKKANTNENN